MPFNSKKAAISSANTAFLNILTVWKKVLLCGGVVVPSIVRGFRLILHKFAISFHV
jgi:hypothetical protein